MSLNNMECDISNYKMISFGEKPISVMDLDYYVGIKDSYGVRSDLSVKYLTLISDLVYTNEILLMHYKIYKCLRSNRFLVPDNSYLVGKYYKTQQYIIHDIKCTVDQMIALISLLRKTDKYIDSIGKLLKDDRIDKIEVFEGFSAKRQFLEKLNNIENSFKHHFTNRIKNYFDSEESVITVFFCHDYSKGFGTSEGDKVVEEPMASIIDGFNDFLMFYDNRIREIANDGSE